MKLTRRRFHLWDKECEVYSREISWLCQTHALHVAEHRRASWTPMPEGCERAPRRVKTDCQSHRCCACSVCTQKMQQRFHSRVFRSSSEEGSDVQKTWTMFTLNFSSVSVNVWRVLTLESNFTRAIMWWKSYAMVRFAKLSKSCLTASIFAISTLHSNSHSWNSSYLSAPEAVRKGFICSLTWQKQAQTLHVDLEELDSFQRLPSH